ncbi:MAG TPA: DUF1385 domain-containing protein [Anaerovoracaceae bacterium]|nr:DUF1385 domain-containing protein [Anaerovoracaceae bacterium]
MELDKIFIKDACPTKIGGQAVLEGIMMKGPDRTAVVIRKPKGEMHIKISPIPKPSRWRKIPIIRGVLIFAEALTTGVKTLLYSAEVLENAEGGQEYEPDRLTLWLEKKFGEKAALNVMLYFSVALAILFTVGIFIILPTWVVNIFGRLTTNDIALNLLEGVLRILMFVAYVALISRMKDIKTVFQFHGAEHNCIHCYENNLELTVENCNKFETLHPRCGTSFLMFVMVISLLLFSLLGWPNLIIRIASRLILIPFIAGLSYELLRFAGKGDSTFIKILSIPGLALQKLTTLRPDERQLEVAIAALKAVLNADGPKEYVGTTDIYGNLCPEEGVKI